MSDQGVPLGVVGDDFEVMAQVDRPLTKVNSVDRIIRVNYPADNLGRHSLPPLNRISSRDSTTRLEQHFLMRQRLQSRRYTRSYFKTARIHKGQKIHDALPTASTQFMREWVMDVYMEN
jgi:hypothetical protein